MIMFPRTGSVRSRHERNYLEHYGKKDGTCILCGSMPSVPNTATMWKDYSTKNNNGTITGATWEKLSSGIYANSFDGTDDIIDFGSPDLLDAWGSGDMTTLLWIYPETSVSNRPLIGKRISAGDGTNFQQWWLFATRMLFFETPAGNVVQTTALTTFGAWNLVGVVRSGNTVTFINDGALNESGTLAPPGVNTGSFILGSNYTTGADAFFKGKMALVKYYNRALSAEEIASIWYNERHLFGV